MNFICRLSDVIDIFISILERNELSFIETSALDSTNVEVAFRNILEEIYHIVSQKQIRDASSPTGNQPSHDAQTIQVAPTNEPDSRRNKCCQ
ncbi:ras-related protein Rab-11B-like [Hydractinia symbiolongicarpus]|uniref:ras-related protein Rab-11B-like n=1 Tax=Hydractinia symbiolongicarpus TaxID=13093 RepID=UPI0025515B9F|nr:ras-related protein Rab-11B-like [Hydractinia symbiolongicarpus]